MFVFGVFGIVLVMNMIGVKVFGEMEFWFLFVKVGMFVVFFVVGVVFFVSGYLVVG